MEEVVIIRPGGGHASIVNELVSPIHKNAIFFVWDDGPRVHASLEKLKRIEDNTKFPEQCKVHVYVAVGRGSLRKMMVDKAKERFPQADFPSVIHPLAYISPSAKVGQGCFVGPFAVINTSARVGDFCIVNTSALVEHDCVVEDYCTINPGAVLCGTVKVEAGATVGANCSVREGRRIGKDEVVGMQAAVVQDVLGQAEKGSFWGGVPAKLRHPVKKEENSKLCLKVCFDGKEYDIFVSDDECRDLSKLKAFIEKDTQQAEGVAKSLHMVREGRLVQITNSLLVNVKIHNNATIYVNYQ